MQRFLETVGSKILVHTTTSMDYLLNHMTLPQINAWIPSLWREIHAKIFGEYPPEKRQGTIEDFQQLVISVNSMFK